MGDVRGKIRQPSERILQSSQHLVQGLGQLRQFGRNRVGRKPGVQSMRGNARRFTSDRLQRCKSTANGKPAKEARQEGGQGHKRP
ncbi:MAG: hypothetical protein AW07_04149 [Candidatus Accumulibacter sp. SK-11]|nr:MAG: hypothetical protein AW07_04149 [Candidatus Accumulibacter sp. SK-11]